MDNLITQLKRIKFDKNDWRSYPILLRWIESTRMQNEINVIAHKVDDLLSRGARSKVKEWISSDFALTQTTAERYLLDNIRVNNTNYEDSFSGGGVDGYLEVDGDRVGIEVTTINKALPEWILKERLLIYLSLNNFSLNDGIEITYDLPKIEALKYNQLDLIEKVGINIIRQNFHPVDGVSLKKISKESGYISWKNISSGDNFFSEMSSSLLTIISEKRKQLSKNKKNILFVGVNLLPDSIFNPRIFQMLVGDVYHQEWIDELERVVQKSLTSNVLGVCFFVYTLPREELMYPLKVIWRDDSNTIPITV